MEEIRTPRKTASAVPAAVGAVVGVAGLVAAAFIFHRFRSSKSTELVRPKADFIPEPAHGHTKPPNAVPVATLVCSADVLITLEAADSGDDDVRSVISRASTTASTVIAEPYDLVYRKRGEGSDDRRRKKKRSKGSSSRSRSKRSGNDESAISNSLTPPTLILESVLEEGNRDDQSKLPRTPTEKDLHGF